MFIIFVCCFLFVAFARFEMVLVIIGMIRYEINIILMFVVAIIIINLIY